MFLRRGEIKLQQHLKVGHSGKHRPATHTHTHTKAQQTLTACWAEAYRLSGGLCYDISTPNETKISLISSGTRSHASQAEGCFCTTSSSPMVRPTPTFGRHKVPCTQSLGAKRKQDCVPLWAKSTRANVNTRKHTSPVVCKTLHTLV